MKHLLAMLAGIILLSIPSATAADTLTFSAPATAFNKTLRTRNPNESGYGGRSSRSEPGNQRTYTWRLDNVVLPAGQVITGATLSFTNVRNWDSNTNRLFVHLFDTAVNGGVGSYAGAAGARLTNGFDNFTTSNPLVSSATGNTFLGLHSFSNTSSSSWTITFNQDQLAALAAYIANGNNLAFGFDPGRHFWNHNITFKIHTTASTVPEPATLALLGSGLVGLYLKRRKNRKTA